MFNRQRIIAIALVLTASLCASKANAYDQQITSNLWAEGYSVMTPSGDVLFRRRFVEDLQLAAWNLIPGSGDPYYKGPRLSIDIALRLDADLGVGRRESSPSEELYYIPGLRPLQVQAIVANINITGLWKNALDLRLGRQIHLDTLGFFAFDGIETRLNLPLGIGLDAYAGYEVRNDRILGFDALELDGTDSGSRRQMEKDQYSGRTEPAARLSVGTELSFSPKRWFDAAFNYRAIGLSSHMADERLGGRISLGTKPVRADARGVWCPLLSHFCEVDAELAMIPADPLAILLEYHLFRPVFEADSIFNVFDLADQNDLGTRLDLHFNDRFSSALWGFIRLSDSSAGLGGNAKDSLISGAGGGLGGNYRTLVREISARIITVQEWGENQVGTEVGMGQAFLRDGRLWVRIRGSFWHIDDIFSSRLKGNRAGYILSARFRISERAYFLGEFENYYYIGGRDPSFSALAHLQLDLWR